VRPKETLSRIRERCFDVPLTRTIDYLIGIPLLHLLAFPRRRRAWPSTIQRVGVHCSPTTGDTVLFSAVLLDLRAHFGPEVEIIHFCGAKNRAAAQLLVGADRRVEIDLAKPLSAVRQFRMQQLDILLEFSSWQRITALLALTSRSRFTIGFRSAGQHRGRAFDLAINHRSDQHELENFRDILRACHIPTKAKPEVTMPAGHLPDPWQQEADIVIFHLWPAGGLSSMRQWPEENWISLAKRLASPKTIFAITGAPLERPQSRGFAERLAREACVRACAFEGEGGLQQLVLLLQKTRLTVSVNTGIMHLSAVAGTPTVSLNGPTADHRWGPRGRCCIGVEPPDGSGGYLHLGFETSRRHVDIMNRITPDQVAKAAAVLLAKCGEAVPSEAVRNN
jgi:heptosyltransferase-3